MVARRSSRLQQSKSQNRKKVWRSAAAQRVLKLAAGSRTVEEAIEIVAKQYLQDVACPPTDLDSIGTKLGITGFESADLAGSGELRKDGDGLRVFYSNYLSVERRRFTIAHELGHAVLERTGTHVPRFGKELERLCDMFAVEVLMPKERFVEYALGEVSTQRILDLARQFRTSVAATGLRFSELYGVSVFACQDSRVIWGKGKIRPAKNAKIDESFRPLIDKALGGEAGSDEVFLSSTTSFRRWLIECRPLALGTSVLCLLRPAGGR
jgi:hypothetical protein